MTVKGTYSTIDTLPVKRWFEILKTGQLHHLYIKGKGRVNPLLIDVWEDLQQQYFDEFGVDDNFRIRMQKVMKLTELRLDLMITGNKFLINHINHIEAEIRSWGDGHQQSNYKIKVALQKHLGHIIPFETTTVIEWGYMVRDFDESGRKAKQEEIKQKYSGRN